MAEQEKKVPQEQEKKARQEKDELMRNMAHDLRTPLTGVMTYVDVMKLENEAYAENMKNLNFISEKVLDIRTQVDNLLDFSICQRGEEGVIQIMTPVALSYPGHNLLTEDMGVVLGMDDCPCGRKGKYFKLTGRMKQAEIRGCSDVYADVSVVGKS